MAQRTDVIYIDVPWDETWDRDDANEPDFSTVKKGNKWRLVCLCGHLFQYVYAKWLYDCPTCKRVRHYCPCQVLSDGSMVPMP